MCTPLCDRRLHQAVTEVAALIVDKLASDANLSRYANPSTSYSRGTDLGPVMPLQDHMPYSLTHDGSSSGGGGIMNSSGGAGMFPLQPGVTLMAPPPVHGGLLQHGADMMAQAQASVFNVCVGEHEIWAPAQGMARFAKAQPL